MKQTKHSRKSEAHKLCSKCPPFTRTYAFKGLRHCAGAAVMTVWSSSLHSLSRRSFNSFRLSHHGSANGRPSLERYTGCRIQIWRIGWPHLWRDKIWYLSLQHGGSVTCTVNGMISVTSTLRQVRDVHGMQRKFTSMIGIHLQSCVPTIIIKICTYL